MSEEVNVPEDPFSPFFKEDKYRERLALLEQTRVLNVDFSDLLAFNMELAEQLVKAPNDTLKQMQHAARDQLLIEDPEYFEKVEELTVKIFGLEEPQPRIRELGTKFVGKLIQITGVVTRTTKVKAAVTKACFECRRCGERTFVAQTGEALVVPALCPNPSCGRRGPFRLFPEESTLVDSQKIWVQEVPEKLPAGQLPISVAIDLYESNVNLVRPGDKLEVVGIIGLKLRTLSGGKKIATADLTLVANSVKRMEKQEETITDEEIAEFHDLAKDPWIHRKIVKSIVPSIYGHDHVKEAIMYLLFGGVPKEREDVSIRGELNCLLIGDPGTAKSQMLKHVGTALAGRGLFTTGKGVSGVGLTAAVLKDKTSGEWTLQAGALVLADRGVACIDEFDKMEESDRNAIHEALEQQTVSVAKAGIVATLNARAAVLAAMNPLHGRINPFITVGENINLPVTLLSRFDLIFLMVDSPDKATDEALCSHILKLHADTLAPPVISAEKLRKYIMYARTINPVATAEALDRLKSFFLQQRAASSESEQGPVAISWRQLEALMRIAEARARVALRSKVLAEDAEAAINIMSVSLKQVGVDVSTGKFDIDIIMTGKPKSLQNKRVAVVDVLVALQRETGLVEKEALFMILEKDHNINNIDANKIISSLLKEGVIFSPRFGYFKKT